MLFAVHPAVAAQDQIYQSAISDESLSPQSENCIAASHQHRQLDVVHQLSPL